MIETIDSKNKVQEPWHIAIKLEELEVFTLPFTSEDEEQQLLKKLYLENKLINNYKTNI